MIIKITQTASNFKQEFQVDYGCERGQGKLGSFLNEQKIILNCDNEEYVGKFLITELLHCIPFLNWFGFNRKTKNFEIYKNGEYFGNVYYSIHGFLKYCYVLTLASGEVFKCYKVGKDYYEYLVIYLNDVQVAQIETCINSVADYKYNHDLYVLPDYEKYADIFVWLTLYYANYNFSKRLHMQKGVKTEKVVCDLGKYKSKYNPSWKKDNFFNKE